MCERIVYCVVACIKMGLGCCLAASVAARGPAAWGKLPPAHLTSNWHFSSRPQKTLGWVEGKNPPKCFGPEVELTKHS